MTDPEPVPGERSRRERGLWSLLVVGISAVILAFGLARLRPTTPLPDRLGPAPAFTLVDQDGRSFSSRSLHGSVWLADFFFTRCRGLCPVLTQRLAEAGGRLGRQKGWRLVSFSVDPAFDAPPVLLAYAGQSGADLDRWTFLTGDAQAMHRVVTEGFHLAVEEEGGPEEPILHSQSIVLVDGEGEIRGYYDATDADAMTRLTTHARRLLEERP